MLEGVIYNKLLSSIEYRERQFQISAVDVVLKLARDVSWSIIFCHDHIGH